MMRTRTAALLLVLLAGGTGRAAAQGSVFGLRGLGFPGRPVSGRSAATGGALGMFDPEMTVNPAALGRWRSVAGWSVGAPTTRSFTGPGGSVDLQTVRFPLFGFAAPLPPRLTLGVAISDYLDRTWTITRADSQLVRGTMEKYTDAGRSIGGISDMAFTVAYRLGGGDVTVGAAFHHYLGSTRLTTQKVYDNTAYLEVLQASVTDFSGAGVSLGFLATVHRFDFAGSVRLNGPLASSNSGGQSVATRLPTQIGLGLRYLPVAGVFLSGSAEFQGWKAADADLVASGHENARDVWSLGLGAEALNTSIIGLHTPLRVGYRWRQLPFLSLGSGITESALSGGFGLSLARDRTTVDVGVEHGTRSTAAEKETFTSLFVGLTVRP
jgi:hypothetical protein